MAEIIKVFKEDIPSLRFIGKKYSGFGHWGEWWQHGWFDVLENAMGGTDKILSVWENGGGYVGVERRATGQPFVYPDEDVQLWKSHLHEMSNEWINAYDKGQVLTLEHLYDLSAIPSFYLLDKDKKVLLKDVDWMDVQRFFAK